VLRTIRNQLNNSMVVPSFQSHNFVGLGLVSSSEDEDGADKDREGDGQEATE
jgi:hypothetical protein